jgi:hypothetical protein
VISANGVRKGRNLMELSRRMKKNLIELLYNHNIRKRIISNGVIQGSKGIIEE